MAKLTVAVFCMPEDGHFRVLRPLIADLAATYAVHVLTHRRFAPMVEMAGGLFVDLFGAYPLEDVDDESMPVPCRYVSFAGHRAEDVLRDLRSLRPALVIYETFSVIARVVAPLLGVPFVNVCPGHNVDPCVFVPRLRGEQRARPSAACDAAVAVLRERYGLAGASPFSYVSALSPWLNVYCEPPAFLPEAARTAFEPVVFYGSLPATPGGTDAAVAAGPAPRSPAPTSGEPGRLRVYVSFGTVVWRYYADEALSALRAIVEAAGAMPDVSMVISLGGAHLPRGVLPAVPDRVRVEHYVDQWEVLRATDVFVTHHGINSTHEAIFHGVPMLSYPFFFDQPALAERCREFGIATPLAATPRAQLQAGDVQRALGEFRQRAESLRSRVAAVREWEREVMAGRPAVLRRIAGLMATS